MSTPVVYYNARDVEFEIENPDSPDEWVPIGGIHTFTMTTEAEVAETTAFGSQGQAESEKMQISKTLALQARGGTAPGALATDRGQAAVQVLADRVGHASLGRLRFAHVESDRWSVWRAHAIIEEFGGGVNEKINWSATFTRSGAGTYQPRSPGGDNGDGANGGEG